MIHKGARLSTAEQLAGEERFAGYLTSIDRAYLSAARNVENAAIKKARAARTRLAVAASVVGVVLVAGATAGYFIWSAGEAAKTQATVNFEIARAEAALRAGKPEEGAAAALGAYRSAARYSDTHDGADGGDVGLAERQRDLSGGGPHRRRRVPRPAARRRPPATGAVTILDIEARTVLASAAIPANPLPAGAGARRAGRRGRDPQRYEHASPRWHAPRGGQRDAVLHRQRQGKCQWQSRGVRRSHRRRSGPRLPLAPCIDTVLALPAGTTPLAIAAKPDGSCHRGRNSDASIALFRRRLLAAAPDHCRRPSMRPSQISEIDFSGDNQLVITGSATIVLDLTSGKQLECQRRASRVRLSPGRREGRSWRSPATTPRSASTAPMARGKAAFTGHVNLIRAMRWSPDGKSLVSFAPNDPVRPVDGCRRSAGDGGAADQ